jgi:hypothetical protein
MKQVTEIPQDPTRPMRRQAIKASVVRVETILRSAGKSDVTPAEIAEEAHLRIERAKTAPATESSNLKHKQSDSE